jgi:SAM-dependent methyltransferase
MMLEHLRDRMAFKKRNLKSWKRNADFWLHAPLRHFVDTEPFLSKRLPPLFEKFDNVPPTVIDMGTGSGWALDLLRKLEVNCRFVGLDFNPLFIEHLNSRHKSDSNVTFLLHDLEEELPSDLHGSGDVVFNFFNFFEIANIESAFRNATLMLKPGGRLVMLTIDSYYLMFALVGSLPELKTLLAEYEERKSDGDVPYFFQKIDLGESESSDYEYASVLYSFADYYKEARTNLLNLIDYDEVVKTAKYIPKVYQYFVFEKPTG